MKKQKFFFSSDKKTEPRTAFPFGVLFCQNELVGVNADLLLRFGLMLKLNATIDECVKSVILAYANVFACANSRSSLSHDDVAGNYCLTVSLLYAKALRLTVTAVLGRTYALLMSKEL
jgi:hypothetical protein